MKIRFVFVFLFHLLFLANGQFYYPLKQDAADFAKRTLLVQILAEDPLVLIKIKKLYSDKTEVEKKLNDYKELLARHNEWIKQAIQKYWKINNTIEFKTKDEIAEILKDIKVLRKYAVLNTGWKNEFHYKGSEVIPIEVYGLVAYVAEANDRHVMDLRRAREKKTDYIFKIVFPTDDIVLSDFVFAVQQFNFHLNLAASIGPTLERYRSLPYLPKFNRAGYDVVKQKTLLLPQTSIPEDKQEEVKVAYGYPLQFVTERFYEEAIDHQFAKHTYITMAWSDRQMAFAYFVVNASEGIILAELGQKPKNVAFENYALGKSNTDESYVDYKQKMGLSNNNLIELKKILNQTK